MRRICVFCGSSPGTRPAYTAAAQRLGKLLVQEGIGLVYGGASVGVMGQIADAVLASGGEAIGVLPQALFLKEIAHHGLTDLRVVASMHERKALMAELADGFIALPGGMGTLEEFCEVVTWAQLGMHQKPCGLLNVERYYDPLAAFFDHAVAHGFVRPEHRAMILVEEDGAAMLAGMRAYVAPALPKWIAEAQT